MREIGNNRVLCVIMALILIAIVIFLMVRNFFINDTSGISAVNTSEVVNPSTFNDSHSEINNDNNVDSALKEFDVSNIEWRRYSDPTGRFSFEYPVTLEVQPETYLAAGKPVPEISAELVASFFAGGDMSDYLIDGHDVFFGVSVLRSTGPTQLDDVTMIREESYEKAGNEYDIYSNRDYDEVHYSHVEVNFTAGKGDFIVSVFSEYGFEPGSESDVAMRGMLRKMAESFSFEGGWCFDGDVQSFESTVVWPEPSGFSVDGVDWTLFGDNSSGFGFDVPRGFKVSSADVASQRYNFPIAKEYTLSGNVIGLLPNELNNEIRVSVYRTEEVPDVIENMQRTGVANYRQPAILVYTNENPCINTSVEYPYVEAAFSTGNGLFVSVSDVTGYGRIRGIDFEKKIETVLLHIATSFNESS